MSIALTNSASGRNHSALCAARLLNRPLLPAIIKASSSSSSLTICSWCLCPLGCLLASLFQPREVGSRRDGPLWRQGVGQEDKRQMKARGEGWWRSRRRSSSLGGIGWPRRQILVRSSHPSFPAALYELGMDQPLVVGTCPVHRCSGQKWWGWCTIMFWKKFLMVSWRVDHSTC